MSDGTAAVARCIGHERLGGYLDACGGDRERALRLYAWNIEAGSAVLGLYAPLEVGIRNAMHRALATWAGRQDWWRDDVALRPKDQALVDRVERAVRARRGDSATTGHVVAELGSGFWEGLLANQYHARLWEPVLHTAFPMYDGRRGLLRDRMQRVRLLRNRAAHHEPIHARDLREDHRYVCEIASFINPELAAWVGSHSRLPRVMHERAATLDGGRVARF